MKRKALAISALILVTAVGILTLSPPFEPASEPAPAVVLIDNTDLSPQQVREVMAHVLDDKTISIQALIFGGLNEDTHAVFWESLEGHGQNEVAHIEILLSNRVNLYLSQAVSLFQELEVFRGEKKLLIFAPSPNHFPDERDNPPDLTGVDIILLDVGNFDSLEGRTTA